MMVILKAIGIMNTDECKNTFVDEETDEMISRVHDGIDRASRTAACGCISSVLLPPRRVWFSELIAITKCFSGDCCVKQNLLPLSSTVLSVAVVNSLMSWEVLLL